MGDENVEDFSKTQQKRCDNLSFNKFFFESVENVSKNPIEFAVTGESVESVED